MICISFNPTQVQWSHLPTLIHCYNTLLRTLLPNLIWQPNLLAIEKFCTTHNNSLMREAKKSEQKSPRITISKYSARYEIHILFARSGVAKIQVFWYVMPCLLACGSWYVRGAFVARVRQSKMRKIKAVRCFQTSGPAWSTKQLRLPQSPPLLITLFSSTCFYQQKFDSMYTKGNRDNLHTAV